MAQTYKARETARQVNAALAKAGLPAKVTDKQVRAFVRDTVAAYDDDGYTAHVYSVALNASIVKAMVARRTASGARGTKTEARATSASKGRSATPKHSARETAARAKDAQAPKATETAPDA